jgi:putative tricarboxylic transport membrane protein
VRIIVPYGAGGIADTTVRILAEKLNARFNQQFVVENRPGAGGIVAAKAGAAAPPDGYVLSLTGNHNAISRSLFKSIPYDILTEFTSISTTAYFDLLLVTRAESPFKSVQDVIAYARANPGKLNIGSINPGSTQKLAAELLKVATGTKVTIVPFRTSPEMAAQVLRGDIDIAFEFLAALQGPIADKKIVVLATTGPTRTSYLPDVPTVKESGIPDYEVSSWNGLSAPTGTPPEIVNLLSTAIIEALKSPDVQQKAKQFGMEARGSTPDEMTARMKHDIAKWAALIEKAGLEKQ